MSIGKVTLIFTLLVSLVAVKSLNFKMQAALCFSPTTFKTDTVITHVPNLQPCRMNIMKPMPLH